MKRIVVTLVAVLALALMGSGTSVATKPSPGHKVGICHRTASDSNPYVFIRVDEAAVSAHIGPDAHPPKNGRYDYWADSASDCKQTEVTPSPSSKPSPTPPPTPSAGPTASPTSSASPSASPTASPSPTSGPSGEPTPSTGPDAPRTTLPPTDEEG